VASFLLRKPVYIATEHASINRRMAKPHLRGLERLCYSRYENIACVSQSAGAAIQAWIGLSPERLKVIPNGVDLARFTSSSHKGDPSSTIHGAASHVIVSVGRLVAAKDYNTALRALSILPHDYTLAIAGDGPERTGLEALAVELKLGDRMRFLGAREDIPAVLATGCVYLQSSRAEGFGIAVIEAMAAGVPVVASRVAGLESIVEGVGFLFNAGDAAECAACLRRMCEDATTCKNARLEGVRRAGEFSIERSADMYVELYTSMLRERAGI
jgi:glycosyltransferase involved in cell wall biosynthesis